MSVSLFWRQSSHSLMPLSSSVIYGNCLALSMEFVVGCLKKRSGWCELEDKDCCVGCKGRTGWVQEG